MIITVTNIEVRLAVSQFLQKRGISVKDDDLKMVFETEGFGDDQQTIGVTFVAPMPDQAESEAKIRAALIGKGDAVRIKKLEHGRSR